MRLAGRLHPNKESPANERTEPRECSTGDSSKHGWLFGVCESKHQTHAWPQSFETLLGTLPPTTLATSCNPLPNAVY